MNRKLRLPILATVLLVAAVGFTGCATIGGDPNAPPDTNRVAALKGTFKNAVASGVLFALRDNPKSEPYFRGASGTICQLHETKQFHPSQLDAALKEAHLRVLETAEAITVRNLVLGLYEFYFGMRGNFGIPPDSFAEGLFEVLCLGIKQGVIDAETAGYIKPVASARPPATAPSASAPRTAMVKPGPSP